MAVYVQVVNSPPPPTKKNNKQNKKNLQTISQILFSIFLLFFLSFSQLRTFFTFSSLFLPSTRSLSYHYISSPTFPSVFSLPFLHLPSLSSSPFISFPLTFPFTFPFPFLYFPFPPRPPFSSLFRTFSILSYPFYFISLFSLPSRFPSFFSSLFTHLCSPLSLNFLHSRVLLGFY